MPDVLIRNIDKKTLARLKERAEIHNRSLQEEHKAMVEFYAKPHLDETRNRVRKILEEYKATGRHFPDGGEELSNDRERRISL